MRQSKIRRDDGIAVACEVGASAALDRIAAEAVGVHGFLRAAWFEAGAFDAPIETLAAYRADGTPLVALPLVARRHGFLDLKEVPGSYWPYRSFPVADDARDDELAAMFASPVARASLGRVWRLGPILADDPTSARLGRIARASGWTVLTRTLATSFVVDLARLTAEGPWPSTKTLRKNRWCERRLAEHGPLEFLNVRGSDWNADIFDRLAAIEAESWVGAKADPRDTKFLNPQSRRVWGRAVADPAIAARLGCSLLFIGGDPAAFTFHIESGGARYYIANSYCARFAAGSPGRILLYRDFQQAVEAGIAMIGWGAGDPGYKTEMGAEPGPAIVDLLLVRGRLPGALARLWWERGR